MVYAATVTDGQFTLLVAVIIGGFAGVITLLANIRERLGR